MQRFIRTSLICFIALTLLCAGAVFVGRSQPEPVVLPELQPCGDSLCYLGILPGQTPWNEAMAIIQQIPDIQLIAHSYTAYEGADKQYTVGFFPVKDSVDPNPQTMNEIDVYNANPPFRIGDVFHTFGSPCSVRFLGTGRLEFGYYNTSVVVFIGPNSLMPESQVVSISLRDTVNRFCVEGIFDDDAGYYQWHGFRQYH